MDELLRPKILDVDPESPSAAKVWNHWRRTFENFTRCTEVTEDEKLRLLINYVSSNIYEHIRNCRTYKEATVTLKICFSKPQNEIGARYRLLTRKQKSDETVDQYFEALLALGKECNFEALSAECHRDEYIRDVFLAGLINPSTRHKLLERKQLSLQDVHAQAKSLELPTLLSDPPSEDEDSSFEHFFDDSVELDSAVTAGADLTSKTTPTSALIKLVIDTRKPRSRIGKQEFTCYHCNKTIFNKDNLRKHVVLHMDDKPFACDQCNYRARLKSALNLHRHVHSDEKPFACEHCSYRCKIKRQLNMHMRVHTGEKPYACVVCGFRANKKISLVKHVRRYHTGEKPFACDICDYRTLQKDALKMHMNRHTGEKPYACHLCEYRAAQRGTLNLHLERHTVKTMNQGQEYKFSCDQCDFKTDLKRSLYMHRWKNHSRVREKKHICEVCGFKTEYASNLKIHLETHSGEKPYSCAVCGASFLRKQGVQLHMTTHSTERPYSCDLCPYKTARRQHLSSHARTHTGEKPYSCHICGYRAAQSSTLTAHMKTHTGEKRFTCEFCSFGTNKKSLFTQHLSAHSPQDHAHLNDQPQINNQVQVQIQEQMHIQIQDDVQVQVQGEVDGQQQPQIQLEDRPQTVQWHPVQLQPVTWQGAPRMTTIAIPDLWSPGRF